jgi:hypothetical protein
VGLGRVLEREREADRRLELAWEKQALSAGGVQAARKALRTRHMNGVEVRKKRPRGVKKGPRGFK